MVKNRLAPCAFALIALITSAQVHAATFTVLNTNASGAGSLSQAFADANAAAGADTIVFDSGTFAAPQTITPSTELVVNAANGAITITGPGPHLLTVSGGNAHRVFYGSTSSNLTLAGMTISGGNGAGSGAVGGGAIEIEAGG